MRLLGCPVLVFICLLHHTNSLKCVTCIIDIDDYKRKPYDCVQSFPPPQECLLPTATHCKKIESFRAGRLEQIVRQCSNAAVADGCADVTNTDDVKVCRHFCASDGCNGASVIGTARESTVTTLAALLLHLLLLFSWP